MQIALAKLSLVILDVNLRCCVAAPDSCRMEEKRQIFLQPHFTCRICFCYCISFRVCLEFDQNVLELHVPGSQTN